MSNVVIASATRTAVGTFGGALKGVASPTLGGMVIKEAVSRAGIDSDVVDEVLMGCVLTAGLGLNPARQAVLGAGLKQETPSCAVNEVCGSGLRAVNLAARTIKAGEADVVVAGGMENMSRSPYLLKDVRWGQKLGGQFLEDGLIHDGLWCPFGNVHMGVTAENIAEKYGIGREEQDQAALASQQRAVAAMDSGRFKDEIIPVEIPQRRGDPVVFDTDEHPRRETSLEKMAKLKPVFKKDGTVTAANASGINDGASAFVLMSEDKAKALGVTPLAVIRSGCSVGLDPAFMGLGPVPATRRALDMAGLKLDDVDLVEVNEAFAVQVVAVIRELGLDPEKVNVNGGAVALGHPIGASGARILATLLFEMKKRGSKMGVATLCIGGGEGVATVVEMV